MATKKFRCNVCGYIHEGDAAPASCPVCGVPASEFTEVKKKGLFSDTNSNAYIILYSTVMVIIVAALLAVTALSLQNRQMANELNEKKSNILQSLGYSADAQPAEFQQMLTDFDSQVKAYLVTANGTQTEIKPEEAFKMMSSNKDLRENYDAGKLILFRTNDGRLVIPVIGMGLWGDIWGYMALEKDMNTVAGVVMAHKGETPGLGAEIATSTFQSHFIGKKLFKEGQFVSVALRKGGAQDLEHEVDAISGGTKTSDGVTAMFRDCLQAFVPYFDAVKSAEAAVAAEDAGVEEVSTETPEQDAASNKSNVENVENNE